MRSLYNSLMELYNTHRCMPGEVGATIDKVDDILRFILSGNDGNSKWDHVKAFMCEEIPLLESFKKNISRKVRLGLLKYRTECIKFMEKGENSKDDIHKLTFSEECLRTLDTDLFVMANKYGLDKEPEFNDIIERAKGFAVIARFDQQVKLLKEYAEESEQRIPVGAYGSNDDFTVKTKKRVPIGLPAKQVRNPIALAGKIGLKPPGRTNTGSNGCAIAAVQLDKNKIQMMKKLDLVAHAKIQKIAILSPGPRTEENV